MRSALLCVVFALLAQREGSRADTFDDFIPTPIPLKEWNHRTRGAAGTLQEIIKTEAPPTIAALPAHYWEDALRHSVYLTLVRDKIDQMIAKGIVVSPDNKPSNSLSKEVDDHDLWEKIKSAPFDRLKEDTIPPGDVAILAKGRLIEEKGGFRFVEDEASQRNCSEQNCTKSVKAFWSVKRVRQRDIEPSTGKYHYELTFSVTSQAPIKQKKAFENPVRTFTVRENPPTDPPQFHRNYESYRKPVVRPQRAIWVHKNIGPSYNQRLRPSSELDRLFTSFFSDEDDSDDDHVHRFKPNNYPQTHFQYSKVGYTGEREFKEPFNHKKIPQFSVPPHSFKFSRPPLSSPPLSYMQHPYVDMDHFANNPYMPMGIDVKLVPNTVKTTRPAVLPTPVEPFTFAKESTVEVPIRTMFNTTEYTTKPNIATAYNTFKHKPTSSKINYAPENVRPPVYSAPPGVFVTMDRKPFKPMPPLKVVHSSMNFKGKPSDFRPSPQVLEDTSLSERDSTIAFRPIAGSFSDVQNKNDDSIKKTQKNMRKFNNRKPTKHESIKPDRATTAVPDIITAKEDTDEFDLEWANILGAMSKTTPMASYKDKTNNTDPTESITTTATSPIATTQIESKITEIPKTTTTTTSTTTPKPTKRTRPPPKYKQDKYKKHKRITTTTTSSTTTTKPPRSTTEKKTTEDLTPQASSASTGGVNSVWELNNKTTTISPTTSPKTVSTASSSTTAQITTTSTAARIVKTEKPIITTIQPKSKNRFRQTTLMYKGTSVKHDKWTLPTFEKNRTTPVFPSKPPLRRKVSKFQGYISSTVATPENIIEKNNITITDTTSTVETNKDASSTQFPRPSENKENIHQDYGDTLSSLHIEEDKSTDVSIEEKDNNEYIFSTTAASAFHTSGVNNHTDKPSVDQSSPDAARNKTKCKKKKNNNLVTTAESRSSSEVTTNAVTTTTEKVTTPDMFNELLGGFTMDEIEQEEIKTSLPTIVPDAEQSESENHERYVVDEDFESFLESLEAKGNHETDDNEHTNKEYDESDEDNEDEESSSSDEEENDSRNLHNDGDDDYYEDEENKSSRPYSLLELMAME